MKKFINILLITSLALILLVGCNSTSATPEDDNKPTVYTSFYPMYDFATKIAGDKAVVINMVPSGIEPHDWEPSAADITGLEKANLFIYNGLSLEHWVNDVINSLENKNLLVIEASKGTVQIEEDHEHEEDTHSHDNEFDSHVWLNPMYAKLELENIKNGFIQADPDNSEYYEANYKKYAAEFDILDKEFRDTISPLSNKDIIVSHAAFEHLCKAYGLNQIAIEGFASHSEPDSARMKEIIDFGKEHNIKIVFYEELVSPEVANTIADAIGAKTDILNSLEGLSQEKNSSGDEYFSIMRQNLKAIKSALE